MTKVVFKATSILMNKITKLRDGIWKILAKQMFATFAKPDRGFIHMLISRGGVLEDVLGLEDVLEDTF